VSDDKNWPRADAWLTSETGSLGVLGAPLRLGSITPGRCDLAPRAIREALHRFSTYDIETDRDLRALPARDFGDLDLADSTPEQAFTPLSAAVADALQNADALVLLGGDNSITRAGVHGLGSLKTSGLLTTCATSITVSPTAIPSARCWRMACPEGTSCRSASSRSPIRKPTST
jgi:formiminoglutamase